MIYLEIALPTPLRRSFDYLLPEQTDAAQWPVGANIPAGVRVEVPFGRQTLVGVLLRTKQHSDFADSKLKPAHRIIDEQPLLPSHLLQLLRWAGQYYQHPLGEVLHTALPSLLRQGEPAQLKPIPGWAVTTDGLGLPNNALKRAPKQAAALQLLQRWAHVSNNDLLAHQLNRSHMQALVEKGLASATEHQPSLSRAPLTSAQISASLTLNQEQQTALDAIALQTYNTYLLEGVTGSGKTEVYLQAIEKVLLQGQSALLLVPEIGLTPQTIERFTQRFQCPIATLHSGLNDRERLDAWLMASSGHAPLVIGTRSAIFTPIPDLGIIIVDEEHDLSFKQQDGFRYSARDMAVTRAQKEGIPLILGSATPSLESIHNANQQRYQHLIVKERAGEAIQPSIELEDIRGSELHSGFSERLLTVIQQRLQQGQQVLVFINRRGYAPTLMCHDCGWYSLCQHCDARMTVHHTPKHLHCHHCDSQGPLPRQCPNCFSRQVEPLGQGTERSEEFLTDYFPHTPVIRVDRDSTRRKHAMQNILNQVHQGDPCILVGTQMLAKGHHFPNVTLVAILDVDQGLFSTDFRGPERMGQLLLQVAGRAGRAEQPGHVYIQSHHVDHPLMQTLINEGYSPFAQQLLHERQISHMPPFRYLAVIRAEANHPQPAIELLQYARQQAELLHPSGVELSYLGPLPAIMEKRQGRFRFILQLNSSHRRHLQQLLSQLALQLEQDKRARKVRWHIDIDPQDMT